MLLCIMATATNYTHRQTLVRTSLHSTLGSCRGNIGRNVEGHSMSSLT